jgi:DNA-binding transcriptional MerR regulator
MSQDEKGSTTNPPAEKPARAEHKNENVPIPEWLGRVYGEKESQIQLIPTHEVLRMANALGIDVDYSTLRFWQKRGLVKGPIRGPVTAGRGTRGYYDTSLLDRIAFIRRIQKHYSLGLESIQTELARLDKKINHASPESASAIYQQRLAEMEMQRVAESKRTMVAMLGKSLGISPEDIATVVIRKKDGQTIRMVTDKSMDESAGRQVPSQSSKAKTERE